MTGIEVVGIVLGAIPLVITGLEHYSQGVRTIRRMWDAPVVFNDLKRCLMTEEAILRNSIEIVLGNAFGDDVLTALLEDPNNTMGRWSDPVLVNALNEKLQRDYIVFMSTIKNMDRTFEALRTMLGLEKDGNGPFDVNARRLKSAWRNLCFTLKISDHKDLMKIVRRDNTYLSELTTQNVGLGPMQKTSKGPRASDFHKSSSYISSIFSALQEGLQGTCQAPHKASVYFVDTEDQCRRRQQPTRRVLLHHNTPLPGKASARYWLLEEIEMRLVKGVTSTLSRPSQAAIGSTGMSTVTAKTKALRFQDPSDTPPSAQSATTSSAPQVKEAGVKDIQDLCEHLQQSFSLQRQQCKACMGYLVDHAASSEHALYWPEVPLPDKDTLSTVSLAELLSMQGQNALLTVASSRRVAATLALGMLQLFGTPWLKKQFGRNEVMFFMKEGRVLFEHPFLSTSMSDPHKDDVRYFAADLGVKNETVFALGILLIELCLRKPFEDLILEEEHILNPDQSKHPATKLRAAKRLSKALYQETTNTYADAARRCIEGAFDVREDKLEDEAFCQAVYQGVVAALKQDALAFA